MQKQGSFVMDEDLDKSPSQKNEQIGSSVSKIEANKDEDSSSDS